MKKKKIPTYNVINWDINGEKMIFYDVMPYLVECWEDHKKGLKKRLAALKRHKIRDHVEEALCRMPETYDEIKTFILGEARYQFWARCEYEVLVTGWPARIPKFTKEEFDELTQKVEGKDENETKKVLRDFLEKKVYDVNFVKIDIFDQIESNIDVITQLFIDYIS